MTKVIRFLCSGTKHIIEFCVETITGQTRRLSNLTQNHKIRSRRRKLDFHSFLLRFGDQGGLIFAESDWGFIGSGWCRW